MATATTGAQESDAHKDAAAPTDAPTSRGRRDAMARAGAGCGDQDKTSAHTTTAPSDTNLMLQALISAAPAASSDQHKGRSSSSLTRRKPAGIASMAAADFPQLEEFGYASRSGSLPGAPAWATGSPAVVPERLAKCTGRGRKPGHFAAHYPAQ
jgi:hypothetical protein